ACRRPWRELCRKQKTGPPKRSGSIGRSSVIRTRDPLLPKQVRYQAALYSVRRVTSGIDARKAPGASRRGGVIASRPPLFKRFPQPFPQASTSCCEARSNRVGTAPVGASPSGKAAVFGTAIPRFESWRPSQKSPKALKSLTSCPVRIRGESELFYKRE